MDSMLGFDRTQFDAAIRAVLVGFSEWVELILSRGVIARSVESLQRFDNLETLAIPHSAGPVIEDAYFRSSLLHAYDFAATGRTDSASLEELLHELEAFEQLCGLSLQSHIGVDLVPYIRRDLPHPQQMCALVLDHVKARHSLLDGRALTLREVALLAGLAEKTVRMAANPKSPDPLVTTKDGHSTFVAADEALRWLVKRGFHPTVMLDDVRIASSYSSIEQLVRQLKQLRQRKGLELDDLFAELQWNDNVRRSYRTIETDPKTCDPRELTVAHWQRLGELLGLENPDDFMKFAPLICAERVIEIECEEFRQNG